MSAIRRTTKNRSAVVLPLLAIDQERNRIANDLHDSIGSMLSTALLLFDTIEATNANRMEAVRRLLQDTQREVRRIAHDMMPGTLSKLGLTQAIHQLLDDVHTSIVVDSSVEYIDHSLSIEKHIHVYRIVQELMCNVVRHAQATSISFQLVLKTTHIYIAVIDNGIGFQSHNHDESLKTIKSRLQSIKGTMSVQSFVGAGCTVELCIPI